MAFGICIEGDPRMVFGSLILGSMKVAPTGNIDCEKFDRGPLELRNTLAPT